MMWRALRALLRKEFLQIRRDTVIMRMLFVMPIIQLILLANAATFEVKTSQLWVVDQDRSDASRALVDRFTASGRFDIVALSSLIAPGDDALLRNDANAVLVIPQRFAQDLVQTRRSSLQLILNAENGSQAGVIQGYAAEIIGRYTSEVHAVVSRGTRVVSTPSIEVRTRGRYNPSLDYKRFMVPGILVQLITLVGTLMTALNIVREKEAGTLDQLNVTPVKPAIFLLAKLLPLWVIGLIEFSIGLLVASLLFKVPMIGSLLVVFIGAGLFLMAALGVGLWVSTVSDTQQQALFVTFSIIMVYVLMSGLFTPIRAMPEWVQAIAQLNPLMHFIQLVRAVLLKGAGFLDVWRQLLALAVIGVSILSLSVGQYRKRSA